MSTAISPHPTRLLPVRPVLRARPGRPADTEHAGRGWALIVEHRDHLIEFLARHCGDEHLAEDLAHDALLRAARHTGSLDRIRSLRPWLVQIAANVQRDHLRKYARLRSAPVDHPTFTELVGREPIPGGVQIDCVFEVNEQRIGGDELYEQVTACLARLPGRDRRVISAYYLHGLGTVATAEREGAAPELIKVWLFRARKRIESAAEAEAQAETGGRRRRRSMSASAWREALGIAFSGVAPWGCAALALLLVFGPLLDAPPARAAPPAVRPAPVSAHWQLERDALAQAGRLRRSGETDAALALYGRIARSSAARAAERAKARVWHAQMRLECGEASALADIEGLIEPHFDPALSARLALALERFAARAEGLPASRARSLRVRLEAALLIKSRVHDETEHVRSVGCSASRAARAEFFLRRNLRFHWFSAKEYVSIPTGLLRTPGRAEITPASQRRTRVLGVISITATTSKRRSVPSGTGRLLFRLIARAALRLVRLALSARWRSK